METTSLPKHTVAFGLSLAMTSIVNSIIVIAKEKNPAVMVSMQKLTGHHWVTHSAIILLLFALVGWTFARMNGGRGLTMTASRLAGFFVSGVVLSGLIIVGFYLVAD